MKLIGGYLHIKTKGEKLILRSIKRKFSKRGGRGGGGKRRKTFKKYIKRKKSY